MITFLERSDNHAVILGSNTLAHTFKFNTIFSMHAVNNRKNLENKLCTGILLLPTEDTPQP